MNFYGFRGALSEIRTYRKTRNVRGMVTTRDYLIETALNEDGDIVATGTTDVQDPSTGKRQRKQATRTIRRRDILAAIARADSRSEKTRLDAFVEEELNALDKLVEEAVPQEIDVILTPFTITVDQA